MFNKLILIISNIFICNAMIINVKNNCPWRVDVYNHENFKFNNVCKIESGKSCVINIKQDVFESGLIKNILGEQATLFEFTKNKRGIWYDISVVPPGCGSNCFSWKQCFDVSKKVGFNDKLKVNVKPLIPNMRCRNLTCDRKDCPDGYTFPSDDNKTFYCHLGVEFWLEWC